MRACNEATTLKKTFLQLADDPGALAEGPLYEAPWFSLAVARGYEDDDEDDDALIRL